MGVIDTIRAAANSIANAIPSRRRQITATASASVVVIEAESGVDGLGPFDEQLDRLGVAPASTPRDGTGHNCSAPTRSPSREVAMTFTVAVRARIVSISSAAASRRCSQLSKIISKRRPESASAMLSVTDRPAWGVTPNPVATTSATAAGSPRGASSISHTPSGNSGTSSAATWRARRVLPTPPTPVKVTRRWVRTSVTSSSMAPARPTKLVVWTDRFPGTASRVRKGGNSTRRPSARTWKIRCTPERSRKECRPRSIRTTSSATNSAVDAATRIWPPCPAAITRAARFNAGPK